MTRKHWIDINLKYLLCWSRRCSWRPFAELWINNKLSRIASETILAICHISYYIKFTISTNHINVLTPTFTSCGECSQPTPTKVLWLCQPCMRCLQAINIWLSTLWSTYIRLSCTFCITSTTGIPVKILYILCGLHHRPKRNAITRDSSPGYFSCSVYITNNVHCVSNVCQ